MTPLLLIRRGLVHHAAGHLVAAFAVAVATAVIVAALLIGASTTATLRERALARLGLCTHLLTPAQPLTSGEALLLSAPADLAVPLAVLAGTVRLGDEGVAIPDADIIGCDERLWALFPDTPRARLAGRDAALSAALAADLGAKAGDELLVTVERQRQAPSGTLFAHHRRAKVTATLRLTVAAVLPPGSAGDFAPWPRSTGPGGAPRAVLVDRAWLAAQSGRDDGISHVALVRSPAATGDGMPPTAGALGLRIVPDQERGVVRIESADLLLTPDQERAVRAAAQELGVRCGASSIYLADRVRSGARDHAYAIIAAVEALIPFTASDGRTLDAPPAAGETWINTWLAEDLAASTGGTITVACPVPAGDGSYPLVEHTLRIAAVLPLAGAAADRGLVPAINGITEAEDLAQWDVPFPIDLGRVTARDDEYWDAHRTTPRLFVEPALLRSLWEQAGGHGRWITALRLAPSAGTTVADLARQLALALPRHGSRSAAGLDPRPVRDEAIAASTGSTDLTQLFLGLGGILILAALLLAALVMRLQVERRAHEIGVLAACGHGQPRIHRLLLAEGLVTTVLGALIGTLAGVAVAAGLLRLLGGAWSAAVGGLAPDLHLAPAALLGGGLAGAATGALALWWGLRSLRRFSAAALIAGGRLPTTRQPHLDQGSAVWIGSVAMLWCAVLMGLAFAGLVPWAAASLGTGASLLVAFFAFLWRLAALIGIPDGAPPSWSRLAVRSVALHPQRSLAVTALMAAAAFILVAVAAQRREAGDQVLGTGGYTLVVETPLPLGYDPATPGGRRRLGFSAEDEAFFADTVLVPLLVAPGDDVSCRDPAAPQRPRLVGIPPALIARDGFLTVTRDGSGWKALDQTDDDTIPVYGDADSVRWILHAGLGQIRTYPLESGTRRLRIAGLLTGSIFAGELLVAESRFRTLFPRRDTPGRFLIACPPERSDTLTGILRRHLGPLGATVTPTRDIIASVLAVQNTYLAVFLALGGLGLAMATTGLAALLARTAVERRWEWALLASCGIGRRRRAGLLAAEHLLLVLLGLGAGLVAAIVATAPTLAEPGCSPDWLAVLAVLALILGTAVLATVATAWFAADVHPADALRRG